MKVVHQLPGRLRFELPEIYRNPAFASRLAGELHFIEGVLSVKASHVSGRVLLTYAPERMGAGSINESVIKCLKLARNFTGNTRHEPKKREQSKTQNEQAFELESLPIARQALFTGVSGLLLLYLSIRPEAQSKNRAAKALPNFNTALTILTGYPILRSATEHVVKRGHLSTELLASIASIASLAAEESRLGLFINLLVYLSTLLRTMSAEYARNKIRRLLQGRKTLARVQTPQGLVLLPGDGVTPGEYVVVKRGERVAVDGQVRHGSAIIKQYLAQGPAKVGIKDRVYAGSVVVRGEIHILAEKAGQETYIGRVMRLLPRCTQYSSVSGNRTTALVDGISLVAMALSAGVYLRTGDARRAISMLIAAAPGAAGLAASMAFGTAAGKAASRGVLAKDGRHVEVLGRADTVLFGQSGLLESRENRGLETVSSLRKAKVPYLGLLTAEPEVVARTASRRLKLQEYWSECGEKDKLEIIRRLQRQGRTIAVISDSETDVLVLSAANVGVALDQSDELNLESANIIVLGRDPRRVAWLKGLAHQSLGISRQNTALSLGVNILGLGLGLGNLLTPLNMAVLHNFSTLGILFNSTRLLWFANQGRGPKGNSPKPGLQVRGAKPSPLSRWRRETRYAKLFPSGRAGRSCRELRTNPQGSSLTSVYDSSEPAVRNPGVLDTDPLRGLERTEAAVHLQGQRLLLQDGDTGQGGEQDTLGPVFRTACLCNNAAFKGSGESEAEGDSTECALLLGAVKAGFPALKYLREFTRLGEVPFSSESMYMAVTGRDRVGRKWAYLKGVPDLVLEKCTQVRLGAEVQALTPKERERLRVVAEDMASRALRVLVAYAKPCPGNSSPAPRPLGDGVGLVRFGLAGR